MVERLISKKLNSTSKCSRYVYNFLIEAKANDNCRQLYTKYASRITVNLSYEEYCNLFSNLYLITKDTKLRDFQYWMLIFKIFTNETLAKWKLIRTDKCDFCEETQTVKHLFWDCETTQKKWRYFKMLFKMKMVISYEKISNCTLHEKTTHLANF